MVRVLIAALLVLSACATEPEMPAPLGPPEADAIELFPWCTASEPARDLPPAIRDSILEARAYDGLHDADKGTADLSRRLPGGFAGVWLGEDGAPVLAMVDPAYSEIVRAELNERAGHAPVQLPPDTRVVEVRWSFAQLWEWSAYLQNVLVAPNAGVWVDLDEVQNRIAVGLTGPAEREELAAQLYARDVPCRLIRLELAEPIEPL